jgi:peroxiredoxin
MPKVAIKSIAPDFSLNDFNGNEVSLSSFQGKFNLLLVFNRGFL